MGARLIDQLISMFFSMCVLNLGDERSNLEKGAKYNRDSGCREGCGDRPWAVAQCGRHGFPRRTEPLPLCEKVINFPHPTPGLSGSKRRWLLPPSKRMVHVPRPAPAALSSKRKSCGPNAIEEKCRPAVRKKMIQVPRPTLVLFRWKRGWSLPIREKAICFPRPTPGLSGSKRRWSLPPVQEDVLLPSLPRRLFDLRRRLFDLQRRAFASDLRAVQIEEKVVASASPRRCPSSRVPPQQRYDRRRSLVSRTSYFDRLSGGKDSRDGGRGVRGWRHRESVSAPRPEGRGIDSGKSPCCRGYGERLSAGRRARCSPDAEWSCRATTGGCPYMKI